MFHASGSGPAPPAAAAMFKSAGYIEAATLAGRRAARSVPIGPNVLRSSWPPCACCGCSVHVQSITSLVTPAAGSRLP